MRNLTKLCLGLAVLLIIAGGVTFWVAKRFRDSRRQQTAAKSIELSEGLIEYESTLDVPDWLKDAVGEEHFRNSKVVDLATNLGKQKRTGAPKTTNESLKFLESLKTVEALELGNNREVTDDGLVHLKPLENLKTLYLYKTGIRGPGLVHLTEMPKLEAISLGHTPLGDSGAIHVGKMSNLTWARLNDTRLTDASMPELAKLSSLKTLVLRHTDITDSGLKHLAHLHQLESLDVSGTGVTPDGVARLQKALPACQIRVTFGLGATPHDELLFPDGDQPTPAEINDRLKELKVDGEVETDASKPGNPIVSLRLFDCPFSNRVVLDLIKHMPELEMLNLRRGFVGGDFLKHLDRMPIKYLSLQETRVTDDELKYLSSLPHLEELILEQTDISDAGLVHLSALRHVDRISLSNTRVTAEGIERLKRTLPPHTVSW